MALDPNVIRDIYGPRPDVVSNPLVSETPNPDQVAAGIKIGRIKGIDALLATKHLPQLEQEVQADQWDSIVQNSPNLARKMQDQAFAAVAKDDTESLGIIDNLLQFGADVGGDVKGSVRMTNTGFYGFSQAVAEAGAAVLDPLVGTILPENPLRRAAMGAEKQRQYEQDQLDAINLARGDAGTAMGAVHSGIQSAGSTLLKLPLALMSGNPSLLTGLQAGEVAGMEYGKARDEGLTPGQAAQFAASQGVIEYATERIPAIKFLSDFTANKPAREMLVNLLSKEIPGEQVATILQDLNEWAVLNPDQTFTDYLKERPDAAAQTLIATLAGATTQTAVTKGVQKVAERFTGSNAQARQAEQHRATLETLNEVVAQSKTKARDVETFRQYVAEVAELGPVQDVFVSAEALNQSGFESVLEVMPPQVQTEYMEALQTGGIVQIPLEEFLTHVMGQEQAPAILDEVKLDPEGMTFSESKAYQDSYQEQFKAEVERAIGEYETSAEIAQQTSDIKSAIAEQLNTVGRTSRSVNDAYATMASSYYTVRAAQMGTTPQELFERMPLNVVGESQGEAQTNLDETTPTVEPGPITRTEIADVIDSALQSEAIPQEALSILGDVNVEGLDAVVSELVESVVNAGGLDQQLEALQEVGITPEMVEGVRGVFNQFAGSRSQTADLDALERAEQQREAGRSSRLTWKETGWIKGADGDWRYEIPDDEAKFKKVKTPGGIEGRMFNLVDLLDHPKLYAAYPQLENFTVYFKRGMPDNDYGMFSADEKLIEVNPNLPEEQQLSTLLHEIQHAIQHEEGFANGGSTDRDFTNSVKGAIARNSEKAEEWLSRLQTNLRFEIEDADKAAEVARNALMYQSADRLIEYANSESPSGKLRLIKNEMQWLYLDAFKGDERAKELERNFYALPKRHKMRERNAFLRDYAFGLAQLFRSKIPQDQLTQFKEDTRSMRGMINALEREAQRARDKLEPINEGKQNLREAKALQQKHEFSTSYEIYQALAGEVEARNTQTRQGMSEQERKESFPEDTADVPRHEVIVRFGAMDVRAPKAASVAPPVEGEFSTNDNSILKQSKRGAYSPATNTIQILRNADLSTFLHESGHAFLNMDTMFAADIISMPEDQRPANADQVLNDVKVLMDWFGIEGDIEAQLNTWIGMTVNEQRDHHEKFAEGFEAYLFKGEAPSAELQSAFQRFRGWLMNVYRNLQDYLTKAGERLTPEVTAVMDRMLASDEQIQQAERSRNLTKLFATMEESGMTPEAFAEYVTSADEATQEAIKALELRSMRDMTWTSNLRAKTIKRLNKEAEALRREVRIEARREVMSQPVYRAYQFLTSESKTEEDAGRLTRSEVEAISEDLAAVLEKRKMLRKEGLPSDVVAEMFGYDSGQELVAALAEANPPRDEIEAVTDRLMLEQHGDLNTPEAVAKAADEAIHNTVRTRVIASELAGLQKASGSVRELSRMAKEYAENAVGGFISSKIIPNKYARQAQKNGKEAEQALRKGDREMAITHKRSQLVNHALTKAAYEAKSEVANTVRRLRKIATTKEDNLKTTRNMDLANLAKAILDLYGFNTGSKSPLEYLELIKNYDPELYTAFQPEIASAMADAKQFDTLTVSELRALRDQVESIWHLARREKQVEIDGKMMDRELITSELTARLEELGIPDDPPGVTQAPSPKDRARRTLQGFRAAVRRVESWVGRVDSGNIRGPFRRYLFTPISEAADEYRIASAEYYQRYKDLLDEIAPSLKQGRIAAPELNYTFGHDNGDSGMAELLHAILHTGNRSNKRKLLLGRGWGSETETGEVDSTRWDTFINRLINEGKLTKAHFDFAQGVWDMLEDTKPLAQRTHREVFGRYFDEVTADEFTNRFGTYRGGYMPALVDPFIVQDAEINHAIDAINDSNAYMFPATSRGFTKSRVEYNRPLALDLRLIPQHVDKVLMFSHMERHVRDVQRTLRSIQGTLSAYDPVAYTDMLLPWLNRSAKQVVQQRSTGAAGRAADRFFSAVRSRAGMGIMFANVMNALQQITGFSITLLKVKPTYLKQGLVQYMKDPAATAEHVAELSPFMKTRLEQQSFHLRGEIEDILLNPSKYDQVKNWSSKHAYFLQAAFQNVVDTITWQGAYNQGLANGETETDAIRAANSAVRETQGSLNPEDISRYETGTPFTRLFTQFASYFNMQANILGSEFGILAQELGIKKGMGRGLYITLFGFLIPAWVAEAIVIGTRGGAGDGDDEYVDEWLSWFFGAPLRNATAMVPGVGPTANLVAGGFTESRWDDRMSLSPAVSVIEAAAKAPAAVYDLAFENGRAKPAIRDVLTLVNLTTGIPVMAAGRPLGYASDVAEGNVEPANDADYVRGLITGSTSPGSRQ